MNIAIPIMNSTSPSLEPFGDSYPRFHPLREFTRGYSLYFIFDDEKTQESLAMLKLVAQGKSDMASGNFKEAKHAFSNIRNRISQLKKSM